MKYIFITILLILLSPRAFSARVQSVNCVKKYPLAECEIKIEGRIQPDDVLFMTGVSDIDTTSSGPHLLGSTGNFMGYEFYAQFIPRIYPLFAIANTSDPTIKVSTKSVLSGLVGISNSSDIVISKFPEALLRGLVAVTPALSLATLALGIILFGFYALNKKVSDGWDWPRHAMAILIPSTSLFILSMSKLLRLSIPTFMSSNAYYLFHACCEALSIWAVSTMLVHVKMPLKILRSSKDITSSETLYKWFTRLVNTSLLLTGLLLSCYSLLGLKDAHSYSVALQTLALILISVHRVSITSWLRITETSLRGSLIMFCTLLLSTVVLTRDSIFYLFFHSPGTEYFIQWIFALLVAAMWFRSREYLSCQVLSLEIAQNLRIAIGSEADNSKVGLRICEVIQGTANFSRVSLLSIKNQSAFLVASAGKEALPPDESPKPLGPMMQLAVGQPPILHITRKDLSELNASVAAYERSFVVLSIYRGSNVQAAIAIMTDKNQSIHPKLVKSLEIAASLIGLEVIAFIDTLISEQTKLQLAAIARCTSGIVFESQDAWGRLTAISKEHRRIIISADGLKTTRVAERTLNSKLLGYGVLSYKKDLYAIWFGLLEGFEFLSKDVRGDDFWAISPLSFQNSYLKQIGPELTGIYLAHLLELHARRISLQPEYLALGFVGAHVAIGASVLSFLTLGTQSRQCIDVDSNYMPRLHRLRSLATPGQILIDKSDRELGLLAQTLKDTYDLPLDNNSSKLLEDLLSFPQISCLRSLALPNEIKEIEKFALDLASKKISA